MSIKSMLVPVPGDGSGPSALAAATLVARRFASHIHALHVHREFAEAIPPGFENVSGSVWDHVITEIEQEVGDRAKKAQEAFGAFLKEQGVEQVTEA